MRRFFSLTFTFEFLPLKYYYIFCYYRWKICILERFIWTHRPFLLTEVKNVRNLQFCAEKRKFIFMIGGDGNEVWRSHHFVAKSCSLAIWKMLLLLLRVFYKRRKVCKHLYTPRSGVTCSTKLICLWTYFWAINCLPFHFTPWNTWAQWLFLLDVFSPKAKSRIWNVSTGRLDKVIFVPWCLLLWHWLWCFQHGSIFLFTIGKLFVVRKVLQYENPTFVAIWGECTKHIKCANEIDDDRDGFTKILQEKSSENFSSSSCYIFHLGLFLAGTLSVDGLCYNDLSKHLALCKFSKKFILVF